MSFTDLMSSARGPGVIGMLLALVVLFGFGLLFMLSFDEGSLGGGKSIEAMIRDAEAEITSGKLLIASAEKQLATAPALKKTISDLSETTSAITFTKTEIVSLKADKERIGTDIESALSEIEDYKDQYREFVRNKAEGTKIEELKTLDGAVFVDVDVRKVSAMGMDIRHRDGFKRIAFENLPEELQDYYQFDKEQMVVAAEKEQAVRKKHEKEVAKAFATADAEAEKQRAVDMEEAKQKTLLQIAAKEARLTAIEQEIKQLESDVAAAENAAAAARSAGRMHLNKSGNYRSAINTKRREYANLQSEIARLRASI